MEPGVPFAVLGAVQLLAVVAAFGLAAAALLRRSVPGALVAFGGLLLAVVEIRTALLLGDADSDDLALARAAAGLVLAAGLYAGGLAPRQVPTSMFGVVVPLAAAGGPAVFAAAAMLLAAVAVTMARRDVVGAWLAGGFGCWAVSAALMPLADQAGVGPISVVALRGVGALAVLAALGILAQSSLLSKVVGAILVGVVAMAIAAVGVVGSVVVSSYDRQARETVQDAADARLTALNELGEKAAGQAKFAALACKSAQQCQILLDEVLVNVQGDFVVRVRRGRAPESLAGRPALTASEVLGLSDLPAVKSVLTGTGVRFDPQSDNVRLTGPTSTVAVIGVASDPANRPSGQAAPSEVIVYGVRIDDGYTRRDLDVGGFGLSLLAGDPVQVVASNTSTNERRQLLGIVRAQGADRGIPEAGLTIGTQGSAPTVALRTVRDAAGSPVAVLAMTRDAAPATRTQRDALRLLLGTTLAALLAVALIAVLLGRRTVEPVRRLTNAAERVAAGDLSALVGVSTRDEVGTLAVTFDAMTGSLSRLTGDLRASSVRLETVLASMTDGLLATDGEGVVTSVNRAALELLGVEADDVLGEPIDVVVDVRDANGVSLVDLRSVLRDVAADVVRPDGSRTGVRVVLTPLAGAEGVVLVLHDITREREVERMKTEFLSNVSHELRTPLTPIRGYAEILANKPGLEAAKVQSFATTIRDESLKLNRVVDLLVDVAAIDAGRVQVSPRAVPMKELLDARLAAWQTRAPHRAKDFRRRATAGLPAVQVDPHWVGKALDELIDNAVKYTPAGTPITLVGALSPDGERVRVTVKDAGPGIPEPDQGSLFASFEQLDGSATRKVGGLGLGLSFVHRLADEAGYPLSLTSSAKGSEFSLDLPRAEQPAVRRKRGLKRP